MWCRTVSSAAMLIVALAAGATPATAQHGVVLGVRGGVSVASASFDVEQTFDANNRTGFAGGVFMDFDAGLVGVQVGAQYTQNGADLDLGTAIDEFKLSYLEIPAVVKVGIPLAAIKPSIFGGVGLSFNTTCAFAGADCKDDVKSTDFKGIAGVDLAIYLGGIALFADGRYHFGLSNINDAGDIVGDLKNRNWTFQAGIGFSL